MAYTLTNLQDDIRNYTGVDTSVLSTSVINTIIRNAENKIYRAVDSDADRFYATSTTTSGNRFVTIPSDLRIIRYVQIKDSTDGNKQKFLDQRDTSFMAEYYNTPSESSGFPKYYANWDANFWVVAPTPNATYEITLAYMKQPTSLTDSAKQGSGTYLSNKYQDLLLYGALVEAYGYLKGPIDMLQYYEAAYKRALASYSIEQEGRRRRDEYQDGVIRNVIKSPSP